MQKTLVAAAAALALVAGCTSEPAAEKKPEAPTAAAPAPAPAPAPVEIDAAKLALFGKLPDVIVPASRQLSEERIALGRMLYFETRLSKNHDLSCNSCHDLNAFGVDGKKFSEGHKKQLGGRNSPSVYNAAGRHVQFWDGRAADVEEQATGPIMNPVEMAMPDEARVVKTLQSIPAYVEAFKKAFPADKKPITLKNVGVAIGEFERKLVTPSRWDKFLAGDKTVLTDAEKAGFNKFVDTGCVSCHMGAYVGGTMFQKLGVMKAWPNQKDQGRFDVTKNEADKMMFSVPSLRNVAKTAPYFHDASAETLEQAVSIMAEYQLGKQLKDDEVKSIAAWLGTLTGSIPEQYIVKPELPASTAKTPKPDAT